MIEIIKILLIEDDDQDAELLNEMLSKTEKYAYYIEHETTLASAIKRLENNRYDLLLTDLGLPDSSNFETIDTLLRHFPDLPIIVLTGFEDTESANLAVSRGAQDYHIKGQINKETLKRSIHFAIERKRSEIGLKESEEKYKNLSAELEETNNLKELLLDVVTHDLKNHSGAIYSLSDSLVSEDDLDSDSVVGMIHNSSRNILEIISNTSSLSSITSGEKIALIELNLTEIIDNILNDYNASFQNLGFRIIFKVKDPVKVYANPIITEVFRNFISNVLDHANEGKFLQIDLLEINDNILCKFIDRGRIIEKEHRSAIFNRRFQVNEKMSRGSGLGLAIVSRVAAAHDAKVWVEPNGDTGNCFCLMMPLKNIN